MSAPLRTTYTDAARALADLQASFPKPLLLHDAVELKLARGDRDCIGFQIIARHEFASGLNATVQGALDAMRHWTAKGCVQLTPAVAKFMADLEAIEAGTFAA